MIDPRVNIVSKRLDRIGKVVAVCSGKGGVGKSVFASALATSLSDEGYKVGLLDIDFTSPSTHVILGVENAYPKEEKGIIPPLVNDLKYMSIIYYSGDNPTPLRGTDVSNAFIEILAVTRWGSLDLLILDMPPGIGDLALDAIRLIEDINLIVITTPSKIAFETVKKLLRMMSEQDVRILGVVENMRLRESHYIEERLSEFNVRFLGGIDFDLELEDSLGDVEKLCETKFMRSVEAILSRNPEIKRVC